MKSQGHSTGNLVGKGHFCTKFSNTGTILTEIANTYTEQKRLQKKVWVRPYPFKIRDW
jgi:hypothetical protein